MFIDYKYVKYYTSFRLQKLIEPYILDIELIDDYIYNFKLDEAKILINKLKDKLKFDDKHRIEHPLLSTIQQQLMLIRTKEILNK